MMRIGEDEWVDPDCLAEPETLELAGPTRPFDGAGAMAAVKALLVAIGEDPERPGLVDTPRRVAALWREFLCHDPGKMDTTFDEAVYGGMVVVSGMRVWSLCEHHLLPFWCDVSIGYIPNGPVLGLSKFGRIARQAAHELQVQERLVREVAASVSRFVGMSNVIVAAKGEHLCMTMRGVKMPAVMTTVHPLGRFRNEADLCRVFLGLAGLS